MSSKTRYKTPLCELKQVIRHIEKAACSLLYLVERLAVFRNAASTYRSKHIGTSPNVHFLFQVFQILLRVNILLIFSQLVQVKSVNAVAN